LTKTKRNETKGIGGDELDKMKGTSMVVHASTNINPPTKTYFKVFRTQESSIVLEGLDC
jgi:hypothetical protein